MSEKTQYESPSVVEYGSLEELTLGCGGSILDSFFSRTDSIGVPLPGCLGGGS